MSKCLPSIDWSTKYVVSKYRVGTGRDSKYHSHFTNLRYSCTTAFHMKHFAGSDNT